MSTVVCSIRTVARFGSSHKTGNADPNGDTGTKSKEISSVHVRLFGFDVKTPGQLELLALGQAGGRGVKAGNPALSLEVRVRAREYCRSLLAQA